MTALRFIFLNGPPKSGKSTLAEALCRADPGFWRESFATPIREYIWSVWYPDRDPIHPFPDLREAGIKASSMPEPSILAMPDDSLHYWTHREEMIAFSEEFMKRRYGDRIFGKLLWRRCEEQSIFYHTFIIDDAGFEPEAHEIMDRVGHENCFLIRLHRRGCSFHGDSRSYITLPQVPFVDLINDGTLDQLFNAASNALRQK